MSDKGFRVRLAPAHLSSLCASGWDPQTCHGCRVRSAAPSRRTTTLPADGPHAALFFGNAQDGPHSKGLVSHASIFLFSFSREKRVTRAPQDHLPTLLIPPWGKVCMPILLHTHITYTFSPVPHTVRDLQEGVSKQNKAKKDT